jgi:hypothetical protein
LQFFEFLFLDGLLYQPDKPGHAIAILAEMFAAELVDSRTTFNSVSIQQAVIEI